MTREALPESIPSQAPLRAMTPSVRAIYQNEMGANDAGPAER